MFHVNFLPYKKSYLSFSPFRRSYMLSRMFCLFLGYLCNYKHALQWEMKYRKLDKYPTVQSQPFSSVQMITSPSCASSVSSLCFTKVALCESESKVMFRDHIRGSLVKGTAARFLSGRGFVSLSEFLT